MNKTYEHMKNLNNECIKTLEEGIAEAKEIKSEILNKSDSLYTDMDKANKTINIINILDSILLSIIFPILILIWGTYSDKPIIISIVALVIGIIYSIIHYILINKKSKLEEQVRKGDTQIKYFYDQYYTMLVLANILRVYGVNISTQEEVHKLMSTVNNSIEQ